MVCIAIQHGLRQRHIESYGKPSIYRHADYSKYHNPNRLHYKFLAGHRAVGRNIRQEPRVYVHAGTRESGAAWEIYYIASGFFLVNKSNSLGDFAHVSLVATADAGSLRIGSPASLLTYFGLAAHQKHRSFSLDQFPLEGPAWPQDRPLDARMRPTGAALDSPEAINIWYIRTIIMMIKTGHKVRVDSLGGLKGLVTLDTSGSFSTRHPQRRDACVQADTALRGSFIVPPAIRFPAR
jgi:hypothetical protein